MTALPPAPRCLLAAPRDEASANRRASAALSVITGLQIIGLQDADRLVVLMHVVAEEILATARGEETEAVEFFTAMVGRMVGQGLGERAGLATMQTRGRA